MIEADPHDRTPVPAPRDSRTAPHAATDPAAVLRVLVERRQALLHRESADLNSLRTYADRLARELPRPLASPPEPPAGIEVLVDPEAAGTRLGTMLEAAETEVLILDRATGTSGNANEPDTDGIRRLLARGVAVRIVTNRRGNDFPGRAQELIALTGHGLQARTAQHLSTGLVLVDRRACLLPPSPGSDEAAGAAALVFGDCLLHRAALPLFESLWDRATPLGSPEGPDGPPTPHQRQLLGLLASGLKDETIARRLGVHVHTARRRITRMLEELDADTRFQAGVQAATRGWLPLSAEVPGDFTASDGRRAGSGVEREGLTGPDGGAPLGDVARRRHDEGDGGGGCGDSPLAGV
ncbi:hypothetical protein ACIRTB_23395 [Streptomyces sp. NPDC101158]|uniref:helix-turn-helix transcriptional regulator n=1 Tax=Streptomyces sp. NPDC101158 TaxID=3366117 RepID=UPI003810A602